MAEARLRSDPVTQKPARSVPSQGCLDAVEILYLTGYVDTLGKKRAVGDLVADVVELHGPPPFAASLLQNQRQAVLEAQAREPAVIRVVPVPSGFSSTSCPEHDSSAPASPNPSIMSGPGIGSASPGPTGWTGHCESCSRPLTPSRPELSTW